MTPLMRPKDIALGRVSTGIEEQLMKNWPWGQRDSINKGPEDSFLEDCFRTDPSTGRPWMVNDGAAQRLLSDVMIARRREDATMSSVEGVMRYLGGLREARKSFLLISTGWIPPSGECCRGSGVGRRPAIPGRNGRPAARPTRMANTLAARARAGSSSPTSSSSSWSAAVYSPTAASAWVRSQ